METRSLQGKEVELINEFEKANLQIPIISETKKKEQGQTRMLNDHILKRSKLKPVSCGRSRMYNT